MNRRGFITGIIAACAAPAIIRTPGLIMPINPKMITRVSELEALKLLKVAAWRRMLDYHRYDAPNAAYLAGL